MIEEAVSQLGLSYTEFLCMTLYQYRLHIEQVSFERSKAWEHTRQINYMIYCALVKASDRVSITEFMPLSTDKPTAVTEEPITPPEEINRIKLLAEQRMLVLQNK